MATQCAEHHLVNMGSECTAQPLPPLLPLPPLSTLLQRSRLTLTPPLLPSAAAAPVLWPLCSGAS